MPRQLPKTKPKVAVLIETSGQYGREVLRGIAHYARLNGPWAFFVPSRGHENTLPNMEAWQGTGIIGRIEDNTLMRAVARAGVPVIGLDLWKHQVHSARSSMILSEMHPDPRATARMAADHLLDRGFKRFAFVGVRNKVWSLQRQQEFTQYLAATQGCGCEAYQLSGLIRSRHYDREQQELGAWLRQLPKPLGVMACNDDYGREVLNAALQAGVAVPDEVGVVGVDNDEVLCELCDPPLSSVALSAEKGGFAAAGLLDAMMAGRIRKPHTILVEPLGVVARRSTEVVAVDDPRVAQALHFIRDHATKPIRVEDVLHGVPMSRRALEMRFRKLLRRSIHDEIIRARLQQAKRLLRETNITLEDLAERSGFGTASHLSAVFRKDTSLTPAQYRKRSRTT